MVPDVDLGSMPFESEIPIDVVPDVDLGSMPFESEIPIDGLSSNVESAENGSSDYRFWLVYPELLNLGKLRVPK